MGSNEYFAKQCIELIIFMGVKYAKFGIEATLWEAVESYAYMNVAKQCIIV
jgi:hypothetical protein